MSAVVSAIANVVEDVVDAVGDVAEAVIETAGKVVETVVDTAEKVVQGALDDPIGTIAKVAAVATGQFELLPVISAADTVAHGGSLADAALSAGIAYVAPTVTAGVGDALADTAIGNAIASTAEATGFESLPGAITKGLGTAATNTAAGVLRGQDLEDALAGGVTAGIGAGVGSAVGKEIAGSDFDTGNKGINTLIGNAAGAATTAELRGKDVSTAIANSVAPGILGLGAGAAYDAAKSNAPTTTVAEETTTPATTTVADLNAPGADANAPGADLNAPGATPGITTLLANNTAQDTGVASDAEDPNAALLTALQQNATQPAVVNETGYQQLLAALYPDQVDENIPGAGENAPEVKQEDVVAALPTTTTSTTPTEFTGLAGTLGDQEGDFPMSIENLPDGSTKVIEFDGSYKLFNTDGSIDTFGPDGNPIELEGVAKKDTDPLGTFIDTLGVDKVDVNSPTGGGSDSTPVTEENQPPKEIVDPDRSGTNLTGLVKSLIPNVVRPAVNWVTNNPVASLVGAGALTGALSGSQETQGVDGTNMGAGYGFDWGQNMGAGPQNGVYWGTQMLNPTWTKRAADGGLMTAPQFVQPTVTGKGLQVQQSNDPTNSVQMYAAGGPTMPSNALIYQAAQQSGLSTDPQTLSKLVALVNQGYSVEQAAQVLQSHQMAKGGIASLGHYSDGGRFLKGPGDGMSDDIPATIAGKQPARLANEEFVIPADVVSHLGNGSSEAGSKVLYNMMDKVRKARTGTSKQGKQINPDKFMPKTRG